MAEKPIVFSTPMVQAIQQGKKTQTRRVIKPQPPHELSDGYKWVVDVFDGTFCISAESIKDSRDGSVWETVIPRYQPGDILWVRETWCDYGTHYSYKANYPDGYVPKGVYPGEKAPHDMKWRPCIHMPRAAARIFLRVSDVRAERVQEISETDAIAEGVSLIDAWEAAAEHFVPTYNNPDNHCPAADYIGAYRSLWDSLNAKRGFGWDVNPWVWVYEYERMEG